MRAVTATVGPLATASANNIALTQSVAGGASVLLNGSAALNGVATLDQPRRVLITSSGNDSGITFTISGTNWSGNTWSEGVTGANAGTVASLLDYKTVTSIVASGATAAAITVGTNGVASGPWVRLDEFSGPQTSIQCDVIGTVNYTLQQTLDDPNDPTNPVPVAQVVWINSGDTNMVAASTSLQSNYGYTPRYARVVINSGTGSVRFTVYQPGTKHVAL